MKTKTVKPRTKKAETPVSFDRLMSNYVGKVFELIGPAQQAALPKDFQNLVKTLNAGA